MTPCPPADGLERLLDCRLGEAEAGPLRQHLNGCPACQACLDELSEPEGLRAWRGIVTPAPSLADPHLARLLAILRATPPGTIADGAQEATGGTLPPFAPSAHQGDLGMLGPYRILAEVGRGGMGVVLKAFDPALARTVALKVLLPERADAAARRRFVREARAAAAVHHDHVVPVHAVSETDAAVPFLVMEYVDGPTLRERLRTEGRLDPREAARLVLQAADGLAAAHALGLIHRDVKPANIIHDRTRDRARVVDFGLVRALDHAGGSTHDGTSAGTPEYMSPEHVRDPDRLDPRADVYGLGVTLYELLTGDVPFRGTPHMVVQRILTDDPLPPRRLNDRIPRDLETVCLKALAKEPARRYASAADLRDDLTRFLAGEPVRARPAGRVERAWSWSRRNPRLAVTSAALVAALVAGSAGMGWMWNRAEANADAAQSNERLERRQRERAEEHLAVAKEAVDKFYTNIYEKGLLNNPELATQKKELIVDALRFYKRMLELELEDPNLIHSAAETAARVGLLTRDVDELSAALPYLKQSVELARAAVAADPNNINRQLLLSRNLNYLRLTFGQMGRLQEAEACDRECVTIYAILVQAFPTEVKYRRDLTAMQVNLANLAFVRGDRVAAKAGYQAALEQFRLMAPLMESPLVAQLDLARIEYNLQLVADSDEEAIGWLEKSRNRRKDLLSQHPNHQLIRRDFAISCDTLARRYAAIPDKRALALDVISEGIREARLGLKADPNHLEFQCLLATTLQTAGVIAYELDQHEDAERYFEETAPLVLILLEKDRNRHRLTVVRMLAERVEIRLDQKRSAEAAKDRQLALQLLDEYLPALSKTDPFREEAEAMRQKLVEMR